MTKQEEIREGMEEIISDMVYAVGAHFTSKEIVVKLQEYENSQDVVLKVESELPFLLPKSDFFSDVVNRTLEKLKQDGFTAYESLVEEKANAP